MRKLRVYGALQSAEFFRVGYPGFSDRRISASVERRLPPPFKNKWEKAIKEAKADEADKIQKQQKIDAENAATEANNTLKANRLKKAKWYIDTLKKRTYYNATTKALIKDGNAAIKRLKGYSEYDSYKASFDSAVKHAKTLPAKQETPDIGGTPSDNTPANPDNYTDATAVPTETPVPAAP